MRYHFAIGWDEPHYLQIAASFAKGEFMSGLHPYWTPMYPMFVALSSFIINDIELAGRIVSLCCGVFVLIPIFYLAKNLFGTLCAFVSIIMLALHTPSAFFSTTTLTEPAFILFIIVGLYTGLKAVEKNLYRYSILTGAVFGISYLIKPEGVGYLATYLMVAGLFALVDMYRRKGLVKVWLLFACLIGFVFVASPYIIYLQKETGRWTLTAKIGANQQFEANAYTAQKYDFRSLSEDNRMLPMDAIYHEGNFSSTKKQSAHAGRTIRLSLIVKKFSVNFYRVLKYAIPQLFGFLLFLFFILGLFRSAWPENKMKISLYLLTFVGFFWLIIIPLFHINDRYLLPGLIICFIWVGKGVVEFSNWIKENFYILLRDSNNKVLQNIKWLSWISVIVVVLFLSFIPEMGKIITREKWAPGQWEDAIELKKAGIWLKENSIQPPILMSTNKAVDFYAGCRDIRKGASFSNNSLDRILSYAHFKNVEYLVVAERYLERFPKLKNLFDGTMIPETLRLVYEDKETEGLGLKIFKLN